MAAIPRESLSWFESVMETIILVVQTLTTTSCLWAFLDSAPLPAERDNDPKELNNLLAPPRNVLRVWLSVLLCFLFNVSMAPKTTSGSFIERYSTGGTDDLLFLNSAALVANISTSFWIFFKLLHWRYLDIIALSFIWCGSLPLYLVLNRKLPLERQLRLNNLRDAVSFVNGEVSVRLYFPWLTGALIFGLLDVAQYIHGSIFSYNVYAGVMIMMLVLAFVTYSHTRDPAVGFMAMWFLGQIITREGSFEGDGGAKQTFEKLLQVANIIWFVFPLMMIIDFALYGIAEARAGTQALRVMYFSSDEEATRLWFQPELATNTLQFCNPLVSQIIGLSYANKFVNLIEIWKIPIILRYYPRPVALFHCHFPIRQLQHRSLSISPMELPFSIPRMAMESGLENLLLVTQMWMFFDSQWAFLSTIFFGPLPPECDTSPQELHHFLAPPGHVLYLWPHVAQCFIFSVMMDPKTTSGRFIERYSTGGTNELRFFYLTVVVSCFSIVLWEVFKLLNWRYLAIIALCFVWCGSLPLYLVLNRRLPTPNTLRDAAVFSAGEMSVRLYFSLLTHALIFGLLDVAQYIHGGFFNYSVYARVMVLVQLLAFVTFSRTRDPAVMFMASWFCKPFVLGDCSFEGDADAEETFKKLQEVEKVVMPVFYLMMMFDCGLEGATTAREDDRRRGFQAQRGYEAM